MPVLLNVEYISQLRPTEMDDTHMTGRVDADTTADRQSVVLSAI